MSALGDLYYLQYMDFKAWLQSGTVSKNALSVRAHPPANLFCQVLVNLFELLNDLLLMSVNGWLLRLMK
jgi:hypothetical protein